MFILEYRRDEARRTTFGSLFGAMRSRQGSHCHVATSPRRDVTTSRRQLKILHLIIKCEGARESRALKNVRPETRIWRTCNTDLKNILGFLYWILFICLIIFGSYDGVLHTLYFVSFLHDVLSSFLGLHQTLS